MAAIKSNFEFKPAQRPRQGSDNMADKLVTSITTDWELAELSRELRDGQPTYSELDRAADYLDQLREIKKLSAEARAAFGTADYVDKVIALEKLIG